ncbi:hypothetical protein IRJ41_022028 [Triplophysa rosa]|uniref:Uncharacterized protein n=1 Tax=Triplophysa rosa TaxID=992332 RepID=A0A9W7TKW0_TRIRA|nr:hypothetical protein IRJ41_022028 [Triplophysa rosa]
MIPSVEKQTPKESSPERSPLLRGALKLSFEPSVTLEQVESENQEVVVGPPRITRSQKRKQNLLHASTLPFLHPSLKPRTSQNNAIAKENTALWRCHGNGR